MQAIEILPPQPEPVPAPKLRIRVRQATYATTWRIAAPGQMIGFGAPMITVFDIKQHGGLFDVLAHWKVQGWKSLTARLEKTLMACPVV